MPRFRKTLTDEVIELNIRRCKLQPAKPQRTETVRFANQSSHYFSLFAWICWEEASGSSHEALTTNQTIAVNSSVICKICRRSQLIKLAFRVKDLVSGEVRGYKRIFRTHLEIMKVK